MAKVGLFFGSFNPVHVGHMIIADYVANFTDLDKVWMVVSPQNPFKNKASLANDYDRIHLVRLAIGDHPKLSASDIEFSLPKPSYTIDTLLYLKEKYPDHSFSLIMGGDNIATFHKWKNHEKILENHEIYVYSRPEYNNGKLANHSQVSILEAPLLNISASMIRNRFKNKQSVRYLLTETVFKYLEENRIYF